MSEKVLALRNLPDQQRLRAARALRTYWGVPNLELRHAGYVFSEKALTSPEYDAVEDDIAIELAVAGDRKVWKNLTVYERYRVREAWKEKVDALERHNPTAPSGLTQWCKAVGTDFDNLQRWIIRQRHKEDE